jgi:hypothetical protein
MLFAISNVTETTSSNLIYTGICAIALALVHLSVNKLKFLSTMPRSRWLSGAGGVSVAYVFVHLLPELSEKQEAFAGLESGILENHVYVMALIGLTILYPTFISPTDEVYLKLESKHNEIRKRAKNFIPRMKRK